MVRDIIKIDESKCDGCGNCVPNCAEGAIQIIDGKARLISDLFCDGLGACIGHCHTGALTIEKREAEPYDEYKVMEKVVEGGPNVIKAHIEHLRDHEEFEYVKQALDYLEKNNIPNPLTAHETEQKHHHHAGGGCPGSRMMTFEAEDTAEEEGKRKSHLQQWPIQLHLVSPVAPYYRNADLLLAADCCGFTYPDFHKDFLKGKSVAIACPKLDTNMEVYLEKLTMMIDEAKVNTITVMIMQVPCCGGLLHMAQQAVANAQRNVPIKLVVVGINGEILQEDWV